VKFDRDEESGLNVKDLGGEQRSQNVFAHSANREGHRHLLVDHLQSVAHQAAKFAGDFGGAEMAWYAGLWHDVGKWSPSFQKYLAECESKPNSRTGGPDHKGAGAILATRHLPEAGLLIQGHHGGLKNPTDWKIWLTDRKLDPAVESALSRARIALPELEPATEIQLPETLRENALAGELFLRMVFSALVDADFLDTERHFQPDRAAQRGPTPRLAELWRRFQVAHDSMPAREESVVDQVRREVYDACLEAAEQAPGLFRLTVPTGGGKTLSAMAFALRHALRHGHDRVIIALPFITITEQTADVYRNVFGDEAGTEGIVLEHHSSVIAGDDERGAYPSQVWARLASENWDAPIIVTTTVQLFESLFANRTQPCRKVHRLSESVIILDEAQSLPPHLLAPILDALRSLCTRFGATVLISTATQPAFEVIPVFADLPAREIVPRPERLFRALSRVRYEWRVADPSPLAEVAELLRGESQALAVLNTRRDANRLLDELRDPGALHLSTVLCGAHRRDVLREVRRRLAAGEVCRLVSTQVIEAGVDIDFPLVLRALGPLDAVIQSAGRCNREGRMTQGRVIVFDPQGGRLPPGVYRTATGVTETMLGRGHLDLDDPAIAREYFYHLFGMVPTDREGIQQQRAQGDFPEVARRFRMIPEDTESVVVDYGSSDVRAEVGRLVERLRGGAADARLLMRRLQPYLVSVRAYEAERYRRLGLLDPLVPGVGRWLGAYDDVRGIWGPDLQPEDLVV
jgi:CRISPR-associated endonuclease/helicase Cas3